MKRYSYIITTSLCFIIPIVLVLVKLFSLGYSFQSILPQSSYEVTYSMKCDAFGEKTYLKTFVPREIDVHQSISNVQEESSGFDFFISSESENRVAQWNSPLLKGPQQVSYSFLATTSAIRYQIDSTLEITSNVPTGFSKYLAPTEEIQSGHPEIKKLIDTLLPKGMLLMPKVNVAYKYVFGLKNKKFKGVTDALTALRLQEASCNGKSRLFVAMLRSVKIPARLVGGLILTRGTKKTSHQWAEVFIGGTWVPFDALNNHFAFLPKNYLILYYNDHFLFSHSSVSARASTSFKIQ